MNPIQYIYTFQTTTTDNVELISDLLQAIGYALHSVDEADHVARFYPFKGVYTFEDFKCFRHIIKKFAQRRFIPIYDIEIITN